MKRRDFLTSALASGLGLPALAQTTSGDASIPMDEVTQQDLPPGTHLSETGEIVADLRYRVPLAHRPKRVPIVTDVPEGEIHIAPSSFSLYWGLGNGEAIRYRVGIGTEELYRFGEFRIGRKVRWPSWTPTRNMIRRDPDKYKRYAGGMAGGPENPLGARALYIHKYGGGDTFMRIHGTPQPWTITQASSSGCVRMINAHVIDLFNRVPVGTHVKLYEKMDDYDPTL